MKSYTILITDETKSERKTTASYSSGETASSSKAKSSTTSSNKMMLAGYHYAKRALEMVASYEVDTIELRTGNVKAQQNASFAYQCVMSVYNIGESIALGAAAGGATGAIVGAAVGVVTKVANVAINSAKLNLSKSLENITLAQNAIRIGAGGDRMGAVQ